ncbi:GGDEF domain-containing protein [Paramagnetospirillum kuznetsovii]|nr:GGDEF domain-containing protein [Paramagnetospirillum kuznetsovii]
MQLDVQTLVVAVAVASGFSAAARTILWRLHPAIPGLVHWVWAAVMGAVSFMLMATRGQIFGPTGLSVAQTLIVVGYGFAWNGFRLFLGKAPLSRPVLTVLATAAVVPALVFGAEATLIARSAVNSFLVMTISFIIARELFLSATQRHVAMRITAWVYGANAAAFLARGLTLLQEEPPAGLMPTGTPPVLALLWWLCMSLAVTLCMVLMAGERLQMDLNEQVSRDPLTGVFNRRAFFMMADHEVAQLRRSGEPLSVLMMDIDLFKQINDRFGHAVGDEVLRRFTALALRLLRQEDVFARMGGEEFVALLPRSSVEMAMAVAERLRVTFAVESLGWGDLESVPITVSIGVAALGGQEDIQALLHRADNALYHAKNDGRNLTRLADGVMAAG